MNVSWRPFSFLLLLVLACPVPALGQPWQGESVASYIEALRADGLKIIYSSDLVSPALKVINEPGHSDPLDNLREVLAAHGLDISAGPSGSLLIVRTQEAAPAITPKPQLAEPVLAEIVVTSSLHRIGFVNAGGPEMLDREATSRLPNVGEDAVRVTGRLPGVASNGISVRNHVRGGGTNEVLFMLDGLRLYEPYHLKDFQSIATIVNPSAIDTIDFYSGGYPVRYGDRMSGVMNMSLREPVRKRETEISLSLFNASVLSAGLFGDQEQGDWLVSARRGNLDLVMDLVDGGKSKPQYQDLLLHAGWEWSPLLQVDANLLASHDKIRLVDESAGEMATAMYDNRVAWLKIISEWSDRLSSTSILSSTHVDNSRYGSIDLPGIVSGELEDQRDFKVVAVRQDWEYAVADNWLLNFGVDFKDLDASYTHRSSKETVAPFSDILDNQASITRDFRLEPSGLQQAAYVELRWQPQHNLFLDAGVRWDQQTYTTADNDAQVSPRLSVLYQYSDSTELRFGWGQFYQAQEINELQVSDGLNSFFPAERSEHIVASVTHTFASDMDLHVAIYDKQFRSLRPHFENVFDPLVLLPELHIDRVRIDATTAVARGLELRLSKTDEETGLGWWLGYDFSEAEDKTPDGYVKRRWNQAHSLKGGITREWGAWQLGLAAAVHSGWPRTLLQGTTDGGNLLLATEPLSASSYAAFQSLDLRVSRDFNLSRGSLTVFLDVSNLYNHRNPCCTAYTVRQIDGQPELEARQRYWLPLVPSLGVIWRF